ncbi:Uncharacterised protein [Vibrio cholerae]|nr:Uncharacterised protein [Vibrio cholerae]
MTRLTKTTSLSSPPTLSKVIMACDTECGSSG